MNAFKTKMKTEIVSGGYPREDKETTMSYDYLSKTWFIYSSVPSHITKMRKRFGEDKVEILERLDNEFQTPVYVRVAVPEECVGFRTFFTDEEKQAKRERRNVREAIAE